MSLRSMERDLQARWTARGENKPLYRCEAGAAAVCSHNDIVSEGTDQEQAQNQIPEQSKRFPPCYTLRDRTFEGQATASLIPGASVKYLRDSGTETCVVSGWKSGHRS